MASMVKQSACIVPARARRAAGLWIAVLPAAAMLVGCSGDLKSAKECYRVGDYPRALRLFDAELDRHPASFEARYGQALVLQELALKAKTLGADSEAVWQAVADAYSVCARLRDTAAIAENWAIALFHLGNKQYVHQRFEPALENLQLARRVDPRNKYVLNLAGILEYSLGRYKEAQETFEYLIALDPGFVSAYLNLGNVLWESGNEDAALVTWKQALTVSPQNQIIIKRIESALQKIAGS
jgi:tetratricopeptide (TPR) repeat protein